MSLPKLLKFDIAVVLIMLGGSFGGNQQKVIIAREVSVNLMYSLPFSQRGAAWAPLVHLQRLFASVTAVRPLLISLGLMRVMACRIASPFMQVRLSEV